MAGDHGEWRTGVKKSHSQAQVVQVANVADVVEGIVSSRLLLTWCGVCANYICATHADVASSSSFFFLLTVLLVQLICRK